MEGKSFDECFLSITAQPRRIVRILANGDVEIGEEMSIHEARVVIEQMAKLLYRAGLPKNTEDNK